MRRVLTVRRPSTPKPRTASSASASSTSPRSSKRLVTRKLPRAADDGYRNPLVPGLRATADAERLAVALTRAAERLVPPGPYPLLAEEPDLEQATWLAFLLSLAAGAARRAGGPARLGRTPTSRAARRRPAPRPPTAPGRSAPARRRPRSPASRLERRSAASGACSSGSRCPASAAATRFDLLATLGAAGRYELEADALHFVEDDATTLAAKRALVSGDSHAAGAPRARPGRGGRAAARRARPRARRSGARPASTWTSRRSRTPGVAAALGLR